MAPNVWEVLIVDDEPDVREMLAMHLRSRGFVVAEAGSGRAAIQAIQKDPERYGLIITDLQLPGTDGFAVLAAAKAANPSVYVVMITGYATLDTAIQAVRLGAYDYVPKPFSLGQIDVAVGRAADRAALERENRQLARQLSPEPPVSPPPTALDRLDDRLARIELLVKELVTHFTVPPGSMRMR
ncbi:MAG TPA: response regulator [Vicinamibacterales bacterium]|nr:response regulator [Vicinamibacterales bacterium]